MGNALSLLQEAVTEKTNICATCGKLIPEGQTCKECGVSKFPTLAQYGKRLPVGFVEGDGAEARLLKEFDLRIVDWALEREISRSWSKIQRSIGNNAMNYVLCVLAHAITSIAKIQFQKHTFERRIAILQEMYIGDVLYMYAFLRVETLGPEFRLQSVSCPSCNHTWDFTADLSTIEVATHETPKDMRRVIVLRDGFDMLGIRRKEITIRPSTWRSLMSVDSDIEAEIFAETLKDSVVAINGVPEGAVLTDKELEQFSKYDIELINEQSDVVSGGPKWSLDIECPSCKWLFDSMIDWRYSSFFRMSSRLVTRRRQLKR